MGSEFNNWYEKWTGSKVKCENTDIIGAWQHQQSKIDELTKQRDSFIKAYEIEIDKSVKLQKRIDEALEDLEYPTAPWDETIGSVVKVLRGDE